MFLIFFACFPLSPVEERKMCNEFEQNLDDVEVTYLDDIPGGEEVIEEPDASDN